MKTKFFAFFLFALAALQAQQPSFDYLDMFDLSYVQDPQISPDGEKVVYRKMNFDIMKDRTVGNLWVYDIKASEHYKLTSNSTNEYSAHWTKKGDKIVFVSSTNEGSEIFVYWWGEDKFARVSQLEKSPGSLSVSPDGNYVAYTMKVDAASPSFGKMPKKPKGAKWAAAPRVTDRLKHEADGRGYITPGFTHVFVSPILGGESRQITSGNYDFRGPLSWSPDGKIMLVNSNIKEDAAYDFRNSEVYKVTIETKDIVALTDNQGPDRNAIFSPDGKHIAYLSYEDKSEAYQVTKLWIMNADGSNKRVLTQSLDRTVKSPVWQNNKLISFSYDDKGDSKVATVDLNAKVQPLFGRVGGTTLGRPYASGSFSVNSNGLYAYTLVSADRPSRLAVYKKGKQEVYSDFNEDFFAHRTLGKVEEINYASSVDSLALQGWVVYPPNYDSTKKYPLLVENHGGPILNYGARFSIEMQLYAAQGYIVFYPNARGSNSYGEEFGNKLYRNYPGEDYDDVMDGVDYLIQNNIAHEDQLFVTGGSAGGLMSAWMVGKSDRFEAAVVVKPVVNWISKTLVADNYYGYANSRYDGQPWENPMHYWKFSPISIVDQINTPTMVMVGMNDLRTPPSEAKQLYHALKLRKVETVLVEIPEASHGIASRPSNLIRKVVTTLAWFEPYLSE
ncbi:MAG: S9 family peptidase [Flavobacteriaceae bacterium]